MISAFEYVTVLISIVVGLGITEVLSGIADLIKQSKRVKFYWPHLLWVLFPWQHGLRLRGKRLPSLKENYLEAPA